MTATGGDAADRALDDALALANDPANDRGDDQRDEQRGPGVRDPLSVALGLAAEDDPVPPPGPPPARSSRSAASASACPASTSDARSADPLSVALDHGLDGTYPLPAYDDGPRPGSDPGRSDANGADANGADPNRPDPNRSGANGRGPGRARPAPQPPAASRHTHVVPAVAWSEARRIARQAGRRLGPEVRPLGEGALGTALARPMGALTDLPPFDSSAMDGWAVSGTGPWRLKGQVLAGQRPADALLGGHAARIATGAPLPPGTTAVLRSEHGSTERRADGEWLHVRAPHPAPASGQDVRWRGGECRAGDELLPAGTLVTPIVLGLAAAAGYDELTVTARPRVEVLVLGDELLDHGLPRAGRVRDALGPMLPGWLRALGAEVSSVRRLVDDEEALRRAVAASTADLLVTTGGTAGGPVDHVHPVLAAIGAKLLVDGVAVRPGHPMLLAALSAGPGAASGGRVRHLIGLPGNPLAAASGVLTLVAPLLRTLAGHPAPAPYAAPLTQDVSGHPVDTRLVPVVFDDESAARPLHFAGPSMLRGLAAADGMAVIPPGGARAGQEIAVLDTGALSPAWGSGG